MRASSIDDSRAFSTRAFAGAIAAGERWMDGDRGRSIVGASAIGGGGGGGGGASGGGAVPGHGSSYVTGS